MQEAVVTEGTTKGKVFDRGSTVPTDGTKGYAEGCLFVKTGNTDNTDQLYCNIGSATSCNFNAVTIASD
jgi:hypothetical protein